MSTKFKTVITTAGAVKLAAATLPGGKKVNLTAMAVGDGGGVLPVPDAGQTRLVNEVWRHALNKISQDNRHSNYVVAELVIPPEVGGFWMRELGLYDDEGALIAVSNMAESYKPELAEGSGRAQTCRMVIIVSSVASVALSIDSTMVMATQDYVDDAIAVHEKSRRHPDATTQEKGFTQLSSATDSEAETLAATPKAVKIAMDNASARLAKERNGADVPNKPLFVQNIGLQDTVNKAAGAAQRTGDTLAWLNVTGLIQSASMRVNVPGSANAQGLMIDWNGAGSGAAGLTNNRGLGLGGFIFRTVDAENKTEYGRVTFNESGEILAGSNLYAGAAKFAIDGNSYGTIWGTGGASEWLSNNLAIRFGAIPVNNATGDVTGTAWGGSLAVNLTVRFNDVLNKIAAIPVDNPTGNIIGTQWGVGGTRDWLSNYLSTKFNGIQNQFNAIPLNNTTGDVTGSAWGGLLSAHLSAKWAGIQNQFNAIPVDNPSGNIRGSAWGNDWLSNHLANKWAGIQSQFTAIPVDNPSGNIHGSAWGNDWLSNYINNRFAAVANRLTMLSDTNGYFVDVVTGFMVQFGWIQSATNAAETSGYNIAFPNKCAGVICQMGTGVNNGNSVYAVPTNQFGFTYRTSGNGLGFMWFAWGK